MLFQIIIWVLAVYGFIELLISLFNSVILINKNFNDMYILIAVKNQEESIEGIIRTIIFKNIYYKNEDLFNNIVIADMGSTDNTLRILRNLTREYSFLKVIDCKDSYDFLNNILESKVSWLTGFLDLGEPTFN